MCQAAEPPPPPPKTPTASPASMRNLRQSGEAGKPSPASAEAMEPPPPSKRRAGSCLRPMDEARPGPRLESVATGASADNSAALKRLQKKLREAERLVLARDSGDALSADEHVKAENIAVLQAQIAHQSKAVHTC